MEMMKTHIIFQPQTPAATNMFFPKSKPPNSFHLKTIKPNKTDDNNNPETLISFPTQDTTTYKLFLSSPLNC